MARYQEFLSLSPKLESFRLAKFHILILPNSDLQTQAKFEYESRLVDIEMMVIKKWQGKSLPCIETIPVVEVRKNWLNRVELI